MSQLFDKQRYSVGAGNDLFMLQMGEVVRIVDLAKRMIRLRGLLPHQDIPITYVGIRPGEKLHEELCCGNETEIITPHPAIVELSSNKIGFQPVLFSDRLNTLFRHGLDEDRTPLEQLSEIIALGEASPVLAQVDTSQTDENLKLGVEA